MVGLVSYHLMMADQESEVNKMALLGRTSAFINGLTTSVCAMGSMVCSGELSVDNQAKLIVEMLELETLTTELTTEFEAIDISNQCIAISKRKFVKNNKRVLAHIEKLQEQGYRLDKVKKSLQLEVETLEKELFYMS